MLGRDFLAASVVVRLIAVMTAVALVTILASGIASAQPTDEHPQYDENNNLKVPQGYDTWIFIGSNIGLGYKPSLGAMTAAEAKRAEFGSFHNIYISPAAYQHFSRTGEFPDLTILAMEHYDAEDKEPKGIVDKGFFNGERSGLEVAVKNSARPDLSSTPWAYYVFTDSTDPRKVKPVASAFPDAACYNCHLEHASTDNVWVQFYPVLRKHKN